MESDKKGSTRMQWLVAILANTALLSYGLQCGWIACSTKRLQSDQSPTGTPLTDSEISWLANGPSLSATVSVGVFTYLVDKYGRRPCIVLIAAFQAMCWIIKLFPSNTTSLIIARMCCGIAGGGCFNVVPMYVKEISQDSLRGSLGMILILAQNVGILAIYALGGYLEYNAVLWMVVWIPVVTAAAMLKAPESPSFLVKVGKADEATATLAFLRRRSIHDKEILIEIDAIKSNNERYKSMPKITYVEICKHKAWRRGFVFMILLMVCHGLNGGFSIVNYASTILAQSGVTISPELQSLSIPAFMIIGSLITMICIERMGRKMILSTSFALSVVSFSSLSAILLVQQLGGAVPGWLPTLTIVMSVCAYAMGVSPMPFVIMSEMFNFQIRAKVMGVLVTLGWLFSFVQLLAFGPIANAFGAYTSFLCFAVVNFLGAFVILVLLPETRDKSVEQIELELEKRLDKK